MKKAAILVLVLAAIGSVLSAAAKASNYPPEYFYQTVYAVHRGPALVAHVGSGTMSADVIGYKQSGYLAQGNPDHIDAVLTITCTTRSQDLATRTKAIRLGREYHGNGYLSDGQLVLESAAYDMDCASKAGFQVAFSDGNNRWDSRYGSNYAISLDEFNDRNSGTKVFRTNEGSGFGKINLKAWDFIVGEMRN